MVAAPRRTRHRGEAMTRRSDRHSRGYFGIGVERPKTADNVGTLMRSAMCFDAAFTFTIGRRCPKQASDTLRSWKHVPTFDYRDVQDWREHIPYDCIPIGVELSDNAVPLERFSHPHRAVYILGPEDGSLSRAAQEVCRDIVQIDTRFCLNLAAAGTVLLYDRNKKLNWPRSSTVEHLIVDQEVAGSIPVAVADEVRHA